MKKISLKDGEFAYTMSADYKPVARVKLRETFIVETRDGNNNQLGPNDRPSQVKITYPNPQTGPIYVESAKKGDTLVVEVGTIKPLWDYGLTITSPGYGALVATEQTRQLTPTFEDIEDKIKVVKIQGDKVIWNEKISFPYKPFYGCIGTAPEIGAIPCLFPGAHGGNMDAPDCCPGNKVYLPVWHDGAYLFLGDVMATQGDGEVCGSCGEHPAEGEITCDVIKNKSIKWPRVESEDYIMTIGSARPMEDAARIAYCELIEWMMDDYGFDCADAYMLLSHIGKLRIANMVNPLYSVVAKCPKYVLG